MKFDGPIKCSIEMPDENSLAGVSTEVRLRYEDGSQVSPNEIDIGQADWPYKWPADITTFKWKILNFTPDIPEQYYQMRAFNAMLQSIGMIIPKKFDFVKPDAESHLRLEFTKNMETFNNNPNVLAQAYLVNPRNPGHTNGLMQWNDNHYFTPYGDYLPAWMVNPDKFTEGQTNRLGHLIMLPTQPMVGIGMHEFGHIFGFHHDLLEPDAIMFPTAKPGYKNKTEINEKMFLWHEKEIKRWQNGYGKRLITPFWTNYFIQRRLRGKFIQGIPYRVIV